MSGIWGKMSGGYNRRVDDHRREHYDFDPVVPYEVKPLKTRIVRIDLPLDLYELIEELVSDTEISRNGVIIRLLREGLSSSERR